jgi:hypothetical protein
MKQVIQNNTTTTTILRSQLTDRSIIGVSQKAGNNKGFYTRGSYRSGQYVLLCRNEIQVGNRWCSSLHPSDGSGFNTFDAMMDFLFTAAIPFEVFIFDSTEELFKWLAE